MNNRSRSGINWGGMATGAGSGAVAGATIGSVVPVVGTGIGALAGGLLGAAGAGLSGAEENEKEKRLEEERKGNFDWQKTMDKKGQFNTERQLGMNALTGMREGFRGALYRALTKG